jgi:hypothetical protein
MLFEGNRELAVGHAIFDGVDRLQDGAVYADGEADPLLSFSGQASWRFEIGLGKQRIAGKAEVLRINLLLFGIRDSDRSRATMWKDRHLFRCRTEGGRVGFGSAEYLFRPQADGALVPRPLLTETAAAKGGPA